MLPPFQFSNRTDELNCEINLAYAHNSLNDPSAPQLQDNQAYAISKQLPQNDPDEPTYE